MDEEEEEEEREEGEDEEKEMEREDKKGQEEEEVEERTGAHLALIKDSQLAEPDVKKMGQNLDIRDCSVDQLSHEERRESPVDSTDSQLNTISSSPPALTYNPAVENDRQTAENLTGGKDASTVKGVTDERDISAENLSGIEGGTGVPDGRVTEPTATPTPQADRGSRSPELSSDTNESSGVLPEASAQLQPSLTSARAKLLSREELIKLFLDISPVKGKAWSTKWLPTLRHSLKISDILTHSQDTAKLF